MDDIISLLNSIASFYMFVAVIFLFGKLTNQDIGKCILGEIIFASLVVLTEVALILVKQKICDTYFDNILALIICCVYASINVSNYVDYLDYKKKKKLKKGEKFDRKV